MARNDERKEDTISQELGNCVKALCETKGISVLPHIEGNTLELEGIMEQMQRVMDDDLLQEMNKILNT